MGRLVALAVAVAALAAAPSSAPAAADPPDPGETTAGTVVSGGAEYRYLRYTPTSVRPSRPAPLVVAAHGCQTTAEQHLRSTLWNRVAEREGFVVLYPDVDAAGRALPGPLNQCWKFFDPQAYFRGNGDPAAIAAMTRTVMEDLAIDEERVYVVGTSAGGLMAAVDAAAYPELYAAVGLVASAGFADGPCFTTGTGVPPGTSATLAHEQMGPRARVVPSIVIGSDGDLAFPASCSDKAVESSLRTNNLVLSGSQEAPLSFDPASVREAQVPEGRAYTVSTFRDPSGCLVAERWIIHGMPHAWPGGTSDPKYRGFTDPTAPSGSEGAWRFLKRFRLSDTALPCAETPPCAKRTVRVRVARKAKRIRAIVNGRRAPARRAGRRVRVTLPSTHRTRTRVAVRGRSGAKAFVRKRAFPGC